MLRGIVLAGGASARMGRPKAALPLTHRADTFLARVIQTLLSAGIPDLVVVTGAWPEVTRAAAGRTRPPVRFVQNADWQTGQLSSILAGLGDARDELVEGALVALVDAPLVGTTTVQRVIEAWRRTRAPIVRPASGDRHGHPVVFDRAVFGELRAADPARGAKTVVRAHEQEIINVPIDDPGAFLDIDTEQEYRNTLRELRR